MLYLKSLIKKHQPQCVFLMETKCNAIQMKRLCKTLGFERFIFTEARGLAGGYIIMWMEGINLKCRWKTDKVIYCDMLDQQEEVSWSMVACYGTPYYGEKENFQNDVETKLEDIKNPRMLFGDLNEVVNANEKLGGRAIWKRKLYLKNLIQNTRAIDLGFWGRKFTWENE